MSINCCAAQLHHLCFVFVKASDVMKMDIWRATFESYNLTFNVQISHMHKR